MTEHYRWKEWPQARAYVEVDVFADNDDIIRYCDEVSPTGIFWYQWVSFERKADALDFIERFGDRCRAYGEPVVIERPEEPYRGPATPLSTFDPYEARDHWFAARGIATPDRGSLEERSS